MKGEGASADLERTIRIILRISRRLAQIEIEIAELTSSEIALLMAKVETAAAKGRNVLGDMAKGRPAPDRGCVRGIRVPVFANAAGGQMSADEEKPSALAIASQGALCLAGANSLAARALTDLRNQEEAEEWLQKGMGFRTESHYEESFKCFEQGIRVARNHSELQFWLGYSYLWGEGISQDATAGFNWLFKAAKRGHAEAQSSIAELYRDGVGVPQDCSLAFYWYKVAAESGDAGSQFSLGIAYDRGEGVARDEAEALVWYLKAANQGDAWAQFCVGKALFQGRGVFQDKHQAVVWWLKAAEQRDSDARFILGLLELLGNLSACVPKSRAERDVWADFAASEMQTWSSEKATSGRYEAVAMLSRSELSSARELAAKWFATHQRSRRE